MSLLTNLQAAYSFDTSTGNLVDSSGNSNTLTNNGTVTFGTGLIGQCASFGQSNSTKYLSIASNLGITSGSSNFSVSYWWRSSNVGVQCGNIEFNYGGGTNGFLGIMDGANNRYLFNQSGNTNYLLPSVTPSTNTWYHVCVVCTSGVATVYVNNSSVGTFTLTPTTGLTDKFWVGRQDGAYGNGDMDIVNVWSRALTTGEVTSLYNGGAGLQYNFGVNTGSGNFLTFI